MPQGTWDATTLQTAIDQIPERGGKIEIPSGYNWIDEPVHLRGKTISFIGEGRCSRLLVRHNIGGPVLDATGSHNCTFRDFGIFNDGQAGVARSAMLLSRQDHETGAGLHLFDNLWLEGYWREAAVVSTGSECNTYSHCRFINSQPGAAAFILQHDPFGSEIGQRETGGSNWSHNFFDCDWVNWGRTGGEKGLWLRSSTMQLNLWGGCFSVRGAGPGKIAGIVIGDPQQPAAKYVNLHFAGIDFETEECANTILVQGQADVVGLVVASCDLRAAGLGVKVESGVKMKGLILRDNRDALTQQAAVTAPAQAGHN
jgi:hypothetical protein